MAAAVELREPLLPLYPTNSQDLGRQSPAAGRMFTRPNHIRKSASIGASRSVVGDSAELNKPIQFVERVVWRRSPEPTAEEPKPAIEISQSQSRFMEEEQGESGITSLSGSAYRDDGDNEVEAGDENESKSLMQLKMEAMTWAAMAKDHRISSLERRLRQALEIAKGEIGRNQELGRLLRESKEREATAVLELEDAKEQMSQLIDAEERLCVQLGDLEVEAVEEDRRYRSKIATLTARIESQDQFIAEAVTQLKAGQLDSLAYVQPNQYRPLAEKLQMAETESAALQTELDNVKSELRVAAYVSQGQSKRLKALEKERRYLKRKGAIRSVRFAPRALKKSETEAPGGEGWKVFSILDFEA